MATSLAFSSAAAVSASVEALNSKAAMPNFIVLLMFHPSSNALAASGASRRVARPRHYANFLLIRSD